MPRGDPADIEMRRQTKSRRPSGPNRTPREPGDDCKAHGRPGRDPADIAMRRQPKSRRHSGP